MILYKKIQELNEKTLNYMIKYVRMYKNLQKGIEIYRNLYEIMKESSLCKILMPRQMGNYHIIIGRDPKIKKCIFLDQGSFKTKLKK